MIRKSDVKVHFVGIGGMGMCGIAEVLINMGYQVSGSDMQESAITRHLQSIGGTISYGHRAENLDQVDVVVVSSAIRGYNPEVEAARARMIPVIPRAEMLGELMRMKTGLAVAGSHGKTTTTTMIASVLMAAGMDPTAVIGGRVNALGLANARWGKSEYLVAEADESDGSFLTLAPTFAVVTNLDPEHLDHYGSVDNLHRAFINFLNRLPFYGLAAVCLDNAGVQAILPQIQKRFVTYGMASQATYRARNIRPEGLVTRYVAWRRAEELGEIHLPMPGQHNVLNSLAVLAICDALDVPFEVTAKALQSFEGIQRRFTVRGEVAGITVVDDFGHHPAEVRSTLAGARSAFPSRRIIAAFQPHRYTRTRDQFQEFARSFYDADKVIITDVFSAGEAPIEGATAEALAKAVSTSGHGDVTHIARRADVAEHLSEIVREGDLVITLGAGDIQLSCNELIEKLEATRAPAAHKNLVVV
ncbi:UDP-N-acetylmuramate--L-alanine ligase [Haliangium ochraceum]|uniref:UDP-N-acetylmuramate--L-alanine ligase n=1 Tax=Haliangium ochraceum (strain DSM 14365 / JCM 11303 / SMP-2) TaxID=502025 RepID=D0LFT9_HALO1|nr:UDP-N-acetylmuramate--L-alanine ligase [Haliangium ochraceum]ACY14541.1 UDP-N-acetylmuramate/alanine ligase [Haliangium ochraceum DSM 14365]